MRLYCFLLQFALQNPDGKGISIYFSRFPHLPFKCLSFKRNTHPETVFSLSKECGVSENVVWKGGGAGWALWAQRSIQDKNHDKKDNFWDSRHKSDGGELFMLVIGS